MLWIQWRRLSLDVTIPQFHFSHQVTLRALLVAILFLAIACAVWLRPASQVSIAVSLPRSRQLNPVDRRLFVKTHLMIMKSDSVIVDALQHIPDADMPRALRSSPNRLEWVYKRLNTTLRKDGRTANISLSSPPGEKDELSLIVLAIADSYKRWIATHPL